jgi:hypothetical protein
LATAFKDGHWYRSKEALAKAGALKLTGKPHATPDGFALMVFDRRGRTLQPARNRPPSPVDLPPRLVMQGDDGHDLLHLAAKDRVDRVEFDPGQLGDLEPLVEYDHLPESRKDYTVYPPGHKLA